MEPSADLLDPLLQPFVEGAAREVRHAALLDAGERLGGARAAALYGFDGRRWRCLRRRGETRLLPPAARVRAVLEGALGPELPGGQAVLSTGADLALALAGIDSCLPGAEGSLDLLEAFLVAVAAIEEGAPMLRELELPGSEPPTALALRGIHGPPPEEHAAELRDLLKTIRHLEVELAHGQCDQTDRRTLRGRLDAACERVGDLLLRDGREADRP